MTIVIFCLYLTVPACYNFEHKRKEGDLLPVSSALAFEIFYIEFWHILSLMLILSANYYIALKARKSRLLYSYFTAQAMLVIWIVSKIFKTVSPTVGLRWIFIVTQYFGVSFLGPALLLFAWVYTQKKLPKAWQAVLFSLPGVYSFIVVLTNPLHYRMYATFNFYSDTFGDLFYINMVITYLYLTVSVLMLSKGFFKMFGRERKRAYLFAAGILFPFVINVFYVGELFKTVFNYTPLFDFTPIATNISLILFTLAAFRYRFLDMLPIAGRQIFEGIGDAVAITDKKGRILRQNNGFHAAFPGIGQGSLLPECLEAAADEILSISQGIYKVTAVQKKRINVISLTDLTGIYATVNRTKTKNTELAVAGRNLELMLEKKRLLAEMKMRSRILQELHDILGHSTVLAVSLCEAEILCGAVNYDNTLAEVKKMLSTGNEEFDGILKANEYPAATTPLLDRLELLIHSAANGGLKAELIIQGSVYETGVTVTEAVYGLCREAVTNAVKHAAATSISLVIRFDEEVLEVFAIDNGHGCANIKNGKGLNGITKRFSAAGGTVKFVSDAGNGFYIHAQVSRQTGSAAGGEGAAE